MSITGLYYWTSNMGKRTHKKTLDSIPYWFISFGFSLMILILLACGGGVETDLVIPESEKEAAVNIMLDKYKADQEGGVVGASVTQEGGTLNLIIMIKRITYLENVRSTANLDWSNQGRKLGTEFVRLVKDGGTDDPTGGEIGKGQFNYTIGVYYQDPANPNKVYANPIRKIVEGKKSAKSSKIKW
tara:strand:+ start:293 stop:850 length:558 start_codon:yes stop_codon:yes gene_type:complete